MARFVRSRLLPCAHNQSADLLQSKAHLPTHCALPPALTHLRACILSIAGSDGLWDNTFDQEIINVAPTAASEVQRSADRIAAMARGHAADNDFQSPYVREALSQG
jgi:hypothetical protein